LIILSFYILQVISGKDFYVILGLSRFATAKDIKKAYRDLSLKWHPDKNRDNQQEAEKRFVEISNAYEVLSDESKRRIYDQHGEDGLKESAQGGQGGFRSPFDVFFDMGGFGQTTQQVKKGPDLHIPLEVSLQDLYLGKVIKIFHKKQVMCSECRGTGAADPDDVEKCHICKGKGIRIITQQLGPGFVQQTQTTCDHCGGTGNIIKSICPHCKGKKVESGSEMLELTIERGMDNGNSLIFYEEGDQTPDTQPGNLIFTINTQPHPYFQRRGNDLSIRTSITLLEALVGFSKKIEHLDGHQFTLESQAITIPGQVFEIKGEGMPIHEYPSSFGNLFVEISIIFPKSLSQAQKTAFQTVLKS